MTGERGVVEARPPVWAEKLLRFSLRARDRDTVTGDLFEEYRENVLPKRGPFGACLWYVRQALSFLIRNPVRFAIVLGFVFGVWNIAYSLLLPLAEDTVVALLGFYGPMFFMPGVAAFAAFRSTGRWTEAIMAAVTVAVITQLVFGTANLIRVNLQLHTLIERSDWQNLVARFRNSDSDDLRAFVNLDYANQTVPKLAAVTAISVACGIIAAAFGKVVGDPIGERAR